MARPPVISYEDVARACVKIIGSGRYPSVDAIYQELGRRGSKSTIHNHQKVWREQFMEQGLSMLPAALPDDLLPAIEAFWSQAILAASQQYSKYEDGWRKELDERKEQADNDALTIEQLCTELDDRKRALSEAFDRQTAAERERDEAYQAVKSCNLTIQSLEQEVQRLNRKAESDYKDHVERLDNLQAQHHDQVESLNHSLDAMKQKHAEDEATYTRMVDYWMGQVDDARIQISQLNEQLSEQKRLAAQDLNLERTKFGKLSQRYDHLQEKADRLEATAEKLRSDLSIASERQHESELALSELKAQSAEREFGLRSEITSLKSQVSDLRAKCARLKGDPD